MTKKKQISLGRARLMNWPSAKSNFISVMVKTRSVQSLLGIWVWLFAASAQAGIIFTPLASFNVNNGSQSWSGLIQAADGNFYGTANAGGLYSAGTVFRMTPDGALSTVFSFNNSPNGQPNGPLIEGNGGEFYGAQSLPSSPQGSIYKISSDGIIAMLGSFNGTNGQGPGGSLWRDADGNIYGTTGKGGDSYTGAQSGYGTAFKMGTNGDITTLMSFGVTNGAIPTGLVRGMDGNFYGNTFAGGDQTSYGTVFKMDTNGNLATLVSFNRTNGAAPETAPTIGADGSVYGTADGGMAAGESSLGLGTIFKIDTNGAFSTLAVFRGTNGMSPHLSSLALGWDGNLYGTTTGGGASNLGTIFQITPSGALSLLHSFTGGNGGKGPIGKLVQGSDGNFYGTTRRGGSSDLGIVFRISVPMRPAFQSITQTNNTVLLNWRSIAGQSYQVEYSTNLAQTDWNTLGGPFTATNGTVITSDTIGPDAQRVYRAVLLP